jgi:hypothetical protein
MQGPLGLTSFSAFKGSGEYMKNTHNPLRELYGACTAPKLKKVEKS